MQSNWAQIFDDDLDQYLNKLLGEKLELKKGGANAEEQDARDKSNEIFEEAGSISLNARLMMLQQKEYICFR